MHGTLRKRRVRGNRTEQEQETDSTSKVNIRSLGILFSEKVHYGIKLSHVSGAADK